MTLLLDTHALLWWWTDDPQLSPAVRAALVQPGQRVLVSAASAWEVAIKQRLGKLPGLPPLGARRWAELLAADGFEPLPITAQHALRAAAWTPAHPAGHRDPFDRMLAAQAELEEARLVSRDPALAAFGVPMLW